MSFKEKISKAIRQIPMSLGAIALVGFSYLTYSAATPGTWMYERNRARDEARATTLKSQYEKQNRMEILRREALEKADTDGLSGLSFQEQENLLKDLGCKIKLTRGRSFVFDLDFYVDRAEDGFIVGQCDNLECYTVAEQVSEEQVKAYVETK